MLMIVKKIKKFQQKQTMADSNDENLITHLEALRNTLLRCFIAIIIVSPIGFLSANPFINTLVHWSLPTKSVKLNFFSPMEVFIVQLKIGLILSFIFAFPFLVREIWSFLLPALHKKERNILKKAVFASTFLFVLGVAFCLYFILPLVMKFSFSFTSASLQPMIGLSSFMSLAGMMIIAFGVMFQFPMLVLALVYFDLISYESLKDKRPYVVVFILILAAIFSPPDIVSQLLLGIPTYLLFEVGLLFSKKIKKQS